MSDIIFWQTFCTQKQTKLKLKRRNKNGTFGNLGDFYSIYDPKLGRKFGTKIKIQKIFQNFIE
jgi:hypothetical protein